MRNRGLRERPTNFRLNNDCALAQGLVFAGLGQAPGSTRYTDSAPYGNHGTLTNMEPATDWVWDGTLNRCVTNYDGAAHHTATSTTHVTVEPLTMVAWIYPTGLAAVEYAVSIGNSAVNDGHFGLRVNGTTLGDPFVASKRREGSTTAGYATGGNLTIDTWAHVAGTFASTTSRFGWLNGVAGAEDTTSVSDASVDYMAVGALKRATVSNYFTGLVADVLIWNRILSASEIQQLADPSNVMLSGLILPPKRRLFPGYTLPSTTITKKRFFSIRGYTMSYRD